MATTVKYATFAAKYNGKCVECNGRVRQGETVAYNRDWHGVMHIACVEAEIAYRAEVEADYQRQLAWQRDAANAPTVRVVDSVSDKAARAGFTAENSQVCPRCLGCGEYSRNYDGDTTCYGCGGLGRVSNERAAAMGRRMVGRGY